MIEAEIIKSRRKSVSIEVTEEGKLKVRVPFFVSKRQIEELLKEKEDWIQGALKKVNERNLNKRQFTEEEIENFKKAGKVVLRKKTEFYGEKMRLDVKGIKITNAQKRLGSCSSKNSICYSWRLMTYSEDVIDYVVVHELSHIVHKNHSRDFYNCIENVLPDYKERIKKMKEQALK